MPTLGQVSASLHAFERETYTEDAYPTGGIEFENKGK